MTADKIFRHQEFLEEIAAERERLQRELDQLSAVEEYHRKIVSMNGTATRTIRAPALVQKPVITDANLTSANRHEACKIALHALGGAAKTNDISRWLVERGMGGEFDNPRVFDATCFTAMKRHPELFKKTGRGEWKLAE